jgi:hypothetical protein
MMCVDWCAVSGEHQAGRHSEAHREPRTWIDQNRRRWRRGIVVCMCAINNPVIYSPHPDSLYALFVEKMYDDYCISMYGFLKKM